MACTGNIKNHVVSIAHPTRPPTCRLSRLRRLSAIQRVECGLVLLVLRCRMLQLGRDFLTLAGVYIDRRELKYACVGGSTPSVSSHSENLMLIAMAIWMLVK